MAKQPQKTQEQIAAEIAKSLLAPEEAEIRRQQDDARRREEIRAQNLRGFSEAAAALLGGIGPSIEGSYSSAASQQAAFAKGYSDSMQRDLNASAASTNSFLAKNGAPSGQMVGPGAAQAAGNVLYGLGGAMPASTMLQQGQAFGAAARMLPATELGRGQESLRALYMEGDQNDAEYDSALRALKSKYPSLYYQAIGELEQRATNKREVDVQTAYLLNEMRKTGFETGVDPKTGRLLPGYTQAPDGTIIPPGFIWDPATGSIVADEYAAAGAKADRDAKAKATANRQKAQKAKADAYEEAGRTIMQGGADWLGSPVESGNPYLPPFRKKGGGYTADERLALRKGGKSWDQAVKLAWEAIGGDQLVNRYSAPGPGRDKVRKELRAMIRRKLLALGFNPPAPKANSTKGNGKTNQPKRYGPGAPGRG